MRSNRNGNTTLYVRGVAVAVQRKRVKNLNLRISREGRVSVSVPPRFPEKEILAFLERKSDWIAKRLAARETLDARPLREWRSGETVLLFGHPYRLVVREGRRYAFAPEEEGVACLEVPTGSRVSGRSAFMKKVYRLCLKEELERRLPFHARRMGLVFSEFRIRAMRSRWGSCQPVSGRLCFNLLLSELPVELLDYVIVHELAHLAVPDHSPAFWAVVEEEMPDWCRHRKALREATPLYRTAEE